MMVCRFHRADSFGRVLTYSLFGSGYRSRSLGNGLISNSLGACRCSEHIVGRYLPTPHLLLPACNLD
jgi:hypothetical protein